MSSPYVKLGNRPLEQWKVTELKEELKRRKLTTSGLKQDLIRRLDEAVRTEMESSMQNAENDDIQSEVPVEKANADSNVSEKVKDFADGEIGIVGVVEPKSGHAVEDCRESSAEGRVIEADMVQGAKPTALEGEQVSEPYVLEINEVNETVIPLKPSSESNSQNLGTNVDGASTALLTDESSISVAPLNGQHLQDNEAQKEAIHSTDPRENDDSKCLQPDPSSQPLEHQVSEVGPDLGFQVTSDSVSAESVSIIEKNELKIAVTDDNVKLELDIKPETVQQSPSSAVPDSGESHPMDVGEPLDENDSKDRLKKKPHNEITGGGNLENVDSFKGIDSGEIAPPEKLNLDRSSGDDSMEEDVMESKHMDDKPDSFTENVVKSGTPGVKEEDHVDVVGHDKPVETKPINVKSESVSGKRKLQDNEGVGNNNAAKKVHRWNAEGLKSSEPQTGSITPKGSSEPKERVVPPASKPPTNSLRIDRFLRPFTLKAVQELLGKNGTVTSFWMDHIKTHCYVSYSSVEEAVETRNAVYNLQWPPNGGRLLIAEFVDPEEVKSHVEAPLASPATATPTTPALTPSATQPSPRQQLLKQQIPLPLPPPPLSNPPHVRERLQPARDRLNLPPPPPPPLPEKMDPPIVTLDDLFRKTIATPRIYYLPLSDELVAAKMKTQGKNVAE